MATKAEALAVLMRLSYQGHYIEYLEGEPEGGKRFKPYVLRTAKILGLTVEIDIVENGVLISMKSKRLEKSHRLEIANLKLHQTLRIPTSDATNFKSLQQMVRGIGKKKRIKLKTFRRSDYLVVARIA